jgi:hypothetical protein
MAARNPQSYATFLSDIYGQPIDPEKLTEPAIAHIDSILESNHQFVVLILHYGLLEEEPHSNRKLIGALNRDAQPDEPLLPRSFNVDGELRRLRGNIKSLIKSLPELANDGGSPTHMSLKRLMLDKQSLYLLRERGVKGVEDLTRLSHVELLELLHRTRKTSTIIEALLNAGLSYRGAEIDRSELPQAVKSGLLGDDVETFSQLGGTLDFCKLVGYMKKASVYTLTPQKLVEAMDALAEYGIAIEPARESLIVTHLPTLSPSGIITLTEHGYITIDSLDASAAHGFCTGNKDRRLIFAYLKIADPSSQPLKYRLQK